MQSDHDLIFWNASDVVPTEQNDIGYYFLPIFNLYEIKLDCVSCFMKAKNKFVI